MNTYNFERCACTLLGGGICGVITWVALCLTGHSILGLPALAFLLACSLSRMLVEPLFDRQQVRDMLELREDPERLSLE